MYFKISTSNWNTVKCLLFSELKLSDVLWKLTYSQMLFKFLTFVKLLNYTKLYLIYKHILLISEWTFLFNS